VLLNHFSCRFYRFLAEKPDPRYATKPSFYRTERSFRELRLQSPTPLYRAVVQMSQKTPDAPKRPPSSHNDGAASRYLPLSA